MARPYGEGIVFNILMKVIYIAYLAMYMAYAVLNYIAETGNDLVNFIVISFISVSIVIFIIANVMDWVYKNADARSKIKVRLHTLRNVFKIIKVGVTILVLAQTITDDSWNALTITMLVISLPTSLLWLLGEYIYVAVKGIFHRGGRTQSEDTDEEYDDIKRVTPVHDTIERVKQFAESELIVMRPHEVDYDRRLFLSAFAARGSAAGAGGVYSRKTRISGIRGDIHRRSDSDDGRRARFQRGRIRYECRSRERRQGTMRRRKRGRSASGRRKAARRGRRYARGRGRRFCSHGRACAAERADKSR